MTPCLPFSSVLLHTVAFSPPQAEDEWTSLPLGTQKTMAFFYLHVRIVTGLSLDGLVLKLIPRKREEMDCMVTNPFNSKPLISLLWSSWLPTNSISSNCPSFCPAILKPLACPFPSNVPIHLFRAFLSSIYSSTIFIIYLSYSIRLLFIIHPPFIHTLLHTLSISPSAYHPSALCFHLSIYHSHLSSIHHASITHPSTLHLSILYPTSIHSLINSWSTYPSSVCNSSFTHHSSILCLSFIHSSIIFPLFILHLPSLHLP